MIEPTTQTLDEEQPKESNEPNPQISIQTSITRDLENNNVQPKQIYESLLLPISHNASPTERWYISQNLQKTKGTLFILPPPEQILRAAYNSPPRPKTLMSSGAVALTKHFQRIPDRPLQKRCNLQPSSAITATPTTTSNESNGYSDGESKHPFWTEPKGSNANKTAIAEKLLNEMLRDAVWRNVMFLHRDVAIYEVRNSLGFGMRWTLNIEQIFPEMEHDGGICVDGDDDDDEEKKEDVSCSDDPNSKTWTITGVSFRGFVEPIEGLSL